MMIKNVYYLLTEQGITWFFFRSLYFVKIQLLKVCPFLEIIFEKKISSNIKKLDIFDVDCEKISEFLSKLPTEKKDDLIECANNATNGKIKVFSHSFFDYGNPINWHLNPINKVIINKDTKWFKIPDFDKKRGDVKIFWEASRFCHFFYFSRAYLLTKEVKYYEAFSNQLSDWIKNNKYSLGVNYKCGQEASLRMINGLIAFSVFSKYNLITSEDEINIKILIRDSYRKILSNFFYAHKCIKNNHTLSELAGMIVGAYCFENNKIMNKAYRLFDKETKRQFYDDGGYIQNSFNYQRFALQIYTFVFKISKKTKIELSDETRDLVLKSASLLYQLQTDSGYLPNYGANDGALIFPTNSSTYRNFKPQIGCIFRILTDTLVYDAGEHEEDIFWFTENNKNNIEYINIERISSAFQYAGLYSFRKNNIFLMLVLRPKENCSGHQDQFHIDLWYEDKNILCDCGTYSYADKLKNHLSNISGHNTLEINSIPQFVKIGKFQTCNRAYGKKVSYNIDPFTGKLKYKNHCHTRKIQVNDDYILMTDEIKGKDIKSVMFFNTEYDIENHNGNIYLSNNKIFIETDSDETDIDIINDYRSLYYLKEESIKKVCIKNKKQIINTKIVFK